MGGNNCTPENEFGEEINGNLQILGKLFVFVKEELSWLMGEG